MEDDVNSSLRKIAGPAALVLAGAVGGGVLAATLSASAETPSPTSTAAPGYGGPMMHRGDGNPAHSQRSDEKLLTGNTAAKVRAAALAKYPGATVQRVETDSDGVYEAHLMTKDGTCVVVEVDKAFKVTGVEEHGPGMGGPGMGGRHHGPRPGGVAPSASPSGSNA
jgi:hypothetical protein